MQNYPLNILTFPYWWYTAGAGLVWKRIKLEYHFGLHKTGLLLFARHMSEPLYGDYTRSGMFLSFIVRIFLLLFKLALFLLRLALAGLLGLAYLLFLPAIIIIIAYQILPLK